MPSTPPALPAENPPRVLYVEDQEPLRLILCECLQRAGYQVETACDGAEGWGKFCSTTFDLVITDLEMPNLDGIGFIHLVRESKRQTHVIVYSSSLTERNLAKLRGLSVDAAITKETDWDTLLTIIRTVTRPKA